MDVILLQRIAKLGGIGDLVKVKDGFARNFLIPQKKALRATESARAQFEARRAEIEAENAALKAAAEIEAKKLEGLTVTLVRQASEDGKLYGSVSARDIADHIAGLGYPVERRHVVLHAPLKNLGATLVAVELHPDVVVQVGVAISRTEAGAEAA